MKIEIDEKTIAVDIIKISINGIDFRIKENQFGEMVINKYCDDDSTIIIKPSVSNEIRLT